MKLTWTFQGVSKVLTPGQKVSVDASCAFTLNPSFVDWIRLRTSIGFGNAGTPEAPKSVPVSGLWGAELAPNSSSSGQQEGIVPDGPLEGNGRLTLGAGFYLGSDWSSGAGFSHIYEWVGPPPQPAAAAPADSPASPSPANPDPGNPGTLPWELVVGGGAAGAAALAVAARMIARKAALARGTAPSQAAQSATTAQPNSQPPPDPDAPAGYILQLSANRLKPMPGNPASLKIDVWKVNAQGGYSPAPEAEINVQVSPTGAGVLVNPDIGRGSLTCSVALCQGPSLTEAQLDITAFAGGAQHAATVRVELKTPLEFKGGVENGQAFMEGGRESWLAGYSETAQQWDFRSPFVYFTLPGQDPAVAPGFAPIFQRVTVTPDVLEFPSPPVSEDGGLTWKLPGVRLKPGADLSDELVFGTGIISLSIQCREPDPPIAAAGPFGSPGYAGKSYQCEINYRLRVATEVALVFEPEPRRTYDGLDLAANEFVADRQDKLVFRAYLNRKDRDGSSAIRSGEITAVNLPKDAERDYDVQWAKDKNLPGQIAGTIASRRPLLAGARRVKDRLRLEVKGRVNSPTGNRGSSASESVKEFLLRPRFLFLKLWVIPGSEPGTSEAGAFLCIENEPNHPLRNYGLRLWTSARDSGTLSVSFPEQITRDDGTCIWYLTYGGLTWDRLAGSTFLVNCGILEGDEVLEWTSFKIDVYENVVKMLKFFILSRDRLQLTNPYFQGPMYLETIRDWSFPDIFRGPSYNFCKALVRLKDWMESFVITPDALDDRYVCTRLRNRIYAELSLRRLGQCPGDRGEGLADSPGSPASVDVMCEMNGIEISQYILWPVHTWAGIHLSGSKPDDDPRFLDPWWRQEWSDANTFPGALLTWKWEIANQAAVVAAVALITLLVLKLLAPFAVAAAGRIGTIGGYRLSKWVATQIIRIFMGDILTVGGAEVTVGGLEAVNLGVGKFLAGSCNPSVAGGHYTGFNAHWIRMWAIPRVKETGLSEVEPFETARGRTR